MSEETIQKLQELYKTGRYECDVWFYQKLIDLAKEMEMYEFLPSLDTNFEHVKKIHKLIQENSDSLNDDFDEQEAASKAQQIKKQIHLLNTKHVESTMIHLQKQKYTSFTQHAANLIQKYNYHPKYQLIVQNILNTVYDPVIRLENVLVCTLFMLRNAQKIDEILAIYERAIENALGVMKQFRKNSSNVKEVVGTVGKRIEEMNKIKDQSEEQLNNLEKMNNILAHVQNYCYGIYFIYTTTVKLCDLVKILEGKKNFILKLNSYKPDVEEIIDLWDHFTFNSKENSLPRAKAQLKAVQKEMEIMATKQLQQLFIGDKGGIEKINRTCKICLRYVQKDENEASTTNVEYHKVCQATVKQLMKQN